MVMLIAIWANVLSGVEGSEVYLKHQYNQKVFQNGLTKIDLIIPVFASIVENRFSHSIKEQTNANSTSKQHDKPSHIIILWFVSWFTQLQVRIFAKVQNDSKDCP